jgi:hypothetical protein
VIEHLPGILFEDDTHILGCPRQLIMKVFYRDPLTVDLGDNRLLASAASAEPKEKAYDNE